MVDHVADFVVMLDLLLPVRSFVVPDLAVSQPCDSTCDEDLRIAEASMNANTALGTLPIRNQVLFFLCYIHL